jgi:hypothetical protein
MIAILLSSDEKYKMLGFSIGEKYHVYNLKNGILHTINDFCINKKVELKDFEIWVDD